ncbi:MAG: ectonucleotide pyrophosphatase/phosphodiesterase [Gemmatimonadaceae bacterium]|nr:ectonucleotide pyrophosphatase/phosphodiesterase [Gemmatimonadaceae bacterium]
MRAPAFVALAAIILACRPAATPAPTPVAPRTVVLISLDAFHPDYLNRPGATRLRELAARGVRAERMIPSFPSKTFPNHYSIVTGLYPEHHGIVGNVMFDPAIGKRFTLTAPDSVIRNDPRWWGGEPIWATAERQGVRAGSFFWPGSEVLIAGLRPTFFRPYDAAVPSMARVRAALEWLALPAEQAPRILTLYFSELDDSSHKYGPAAPQTDTAIARVDSIVGAVIDGIEKLGRAATTDIIVVSDHGMSEMSRERLIPLDDYIDLNDVEVVEYSPVGMVIPKPGRLEAVYAGLKRAPHMQVFKRAEVPQRFHFDDSPRITPLVLLADDGWIMTTKALIRASTYFNLGAHGYDNQLRSMGALFVAAGPDFPRGRVVPPFENVNVYPLLADLLGIRPAPSDGSLAAVRTLRR